MHSSNIIINFKEEYDRIIKRGRKKHVRKAENGREFSNISCDQFLQLKIASIVCGHESVILVVIFS